MHRDRIPVRGAHCDNSLLPLSFRFFFDLPDQLFGCVKRNSGLHSHPPQDLLHKRFRALFPFSRFFYAGLYRGSRLRPAGIPAFAGIGVSCQYIKIVREAVHVFFGPAVGTEADAHERKRPFRPPRHRTGNVDLRRQPRLSGKDRHFRSFKQAFQAVDLLLEELCLILLQPVFVVVGICDTVHHGNQR